MFSSWDGRRVLSGLIAAGMLVIVSAGCNTDDKLGYVSGHIKLDGQPVPKANVEFQPAEGSPSFATTDANGYYSLKLTGDKSGAEVGTHTVRISTFWIDTLEDGSKKERPELFPLKYNEQSELKKEVKGGSQTIDFDLESK